VRDSYFSHIGVRGQKSLETSDLDYVAQNGRITGYWWVGKNVEGSGRGLIWVVSRNLPGGTQENHENVSHGSQSPAWDLNLGPPEYKSGVCHFVNSVVGLEFLPRKFLNITSYKPLSENYLTIMGGMFEQQNPLPLANLVFKHRQLVLCDVPLSN
jgi:hypothetical protein